MNYTFTYTDEKDKSYGLSGMALAMYAGDSCAMLRSVSLDSTDAQITFTPDFFFTASPRYSAKIAWSEMLKQYRTLNLLIVSNVLSRHILLHRQAVTSTLLDEMLGLVRDEGRDECQLDDDEIQRVFDKACYDMRNLLSNPKVAEIMGRMASLLCEKRALSGSEISELIER